MLDTEAQPVLLGSQPLTAKSVRQAYLGKGFVWVVMTGFLFILSSCELGCMPKVSLLTCDVGQTLWFLCPVPRVD